MEQLNQTHDTEQPEERDGNASILCVLHTHEENGQLIQIHNEDQQVKKVYRLTLKVNCVLLLTAMTCIGLMSYKKIHSFNIMFTA